MVFFKENHDWGIKKEIECLPYLKEIINEEVIHDTGIFNKFDYHTKSYDIELKSRTIQSTDFETTFTTPTKRTKANNSNKKILWLFSFTDGLFFLNYTDHKKLINSLKIETYNTRFGERQNINIPINILKPFNEETFSMISI